LNLQTILFALTKAKVKSLKLMAETQRIARITALFDDSSSVLISPVSGCCLAQVPNVAKKPVKQILHDISRYLSLFLIQNRSRDHSRTSIYSLQSEGEIVLYRADNTPCIAEYTIRTKTERNAITCMAQINPMRTHLMDISTRQTSTKKSLEKQVVFFGHANGQISLFQGSDYFSLSHRVPDERRGGGVFLPPEIEKLSDVPSKIFNTFCQIFRLS
jgi:hypothetical protein